MFYSGDCIVLAYQLRFSSLFACCTEMPPKRKKPPASSSAPAAAKKAKKAAAPTKAKAPKANASSTKKSKEENGLTPEEREIYLNSMVAYQLKRACKENKQLVGGLKEARVQRLVNSPFTRDCPLPLFSHTLLVLFMGGSSRLGGRRILTQLK